MHWIASGLILYAFAVPSSITGVAYTFYHSGILLGTVMCILATVASACGALLLLKLILGAPQGHRRPRMFSDLGALATGRISGANAALCLQLTNFVLYQPVALLTTASAMQAHAEPTPSHNAARLPLGLGHGERPSSPFLACAHTSCRGSPPHPRPVVALAQP